MKKVKCYLCECNEVQAKVFGRSVCKSCLGIMDQVRKQIDLLRPLNK